MPYIRIDETYTILPEVRMLSVLAQPENLKMFVTRTGPVYVVHEDGSVVSYGASARLDMSTRTARTRGRSTRCS